MTLWPSIVPRWHLLQESGVKVTLVQVGSRAQTLGVHEVALSPNIQPSARKNPESDSWARWTPYTNHISRGGKKGKKGKTAGIGGVGFAWGI